MQYHKALVIPVSPLGQNVQLKTNAANLFRVTLSIKAGVWRNDRELIIVISV